MPDETQPRFKCLKKIYDAADTHIYGRDGKVYIDDVFDQTGAHETVINTVQDALAYAEAIRLAALDAQADKIARERGE